MGNYISYLLFGILMAAFLTGCGPDLPDSVAQAYRELPKELDFNQDIKPILSDKCYACHGPDQAKQKAGLRLDKSLDAYEELGVDSGKFAIRPGNLQKSEVFHRIISTTRSIQSYQ